MYRKVLVFVAMAAAAGLICAAGCTKAEKSPVVEEVVKEIKVEKVVPPAPPVEEKKAEEAAKPEMAPPPPPPAAPAPAEQK